MENLIPPRVEGTVTVRAGRRLGVADFGPRDARTVLWFHGTPGGRRQVPQAARRFAERRGLRIIGVDRPGIGLSTRYLYPSIHDFTEDLSIVLDRLEVDRFAVVGPSGGGPYALASAHAMPDRVVAVGVLGGVAPTVGDEAVGGGVVGSLARFRSLYPFLRWPVERTVRTLIAVVGPLGLGPQCIDLYRRVSPEGDRRVLGRPEIREMFLDDLIGNARTGINAPIFDLMLFLRHWGFAVSDIRVPVRWWHGDSDHIVPLAHGRHVVPLIPDARLHVRTAESHLGGLGAAEEVLATLSDLWDASDRAAADAAASAAASAGHIGS